MASSHIILPKEEEQEEQEAGLGVAVEADHDSPAQRSYQEGPGKAALPFSATCVRISRDSYPNLRALRNASAMTLRDDDATYVKLEEGDYGYLLDDVPHLTDYLPDLATFPNPLQDHPAYSTVKQYFVNADDTVPEKVVVQKNSPRGVHFRRAGPRQRVHFESEEVKACIVTCGGLCPGLNTVIRELVCGLSHMYNVNNVFGIQDGYKGFYSSNYLPMTPKSVNDIHKRGGTILGTSRGGHDTKKIVDNIQDRGINQVYIIGGDGTQKGAYEIFKEIRRRGLKVAVAGIPKTIDNDIAVIDKSFGFDTAVEEAQRAINAAHVEASSAENGIGFVKLMGRYSGFIAMYATLASRDVDCCLIPESPFYLEGEGGLFEYIERRLKENNHMVIVVAEGAGQDLIAQSIPAADQQDASGNKLLLDVGLWLTHKIKDYCKSKKMEMTIKYIDPTYMIRAIPSNASDNVYCTLLAHSAIHGAMAGYSFTIGMVNGRHAYIPFHRVTSTRNKVRITDRMWARLLSSTNQPSFLGQKDIDAAREADKAANNRENGEDTKKQSSSLLANASNGVVEAPAPSTPSQQPTAETLAPPSVAPDARAPGSDNADETGAAAAHQEEQPNQETETAEEAAAASPTGTHAQEKPTRGANVSSPATPPETPERDMAPPSKAGEHARAAEMAPDVDTVKLEGCTTPPPPPAHDSDGSDTQSADGHGNPVRGEKPKSEGSSVKRDVAAAKSSLLAFRSFSRDKKVNKSRDAAPPQGLAPMPPGGDRQVHGKAGEESAEHKEKGKERRKRFWK
ncbi:ATP-dependent 6-phosphofructokinase 6-like [Phragmites australis]|uniref:ATP-dependent 6-phosphofructokinase 6-like n=1 Tax=Phragmites australis TaxID=29695 RepID=UPI002D7894EE|nr:ATP-dependent 6-phosphofructokinase 6-like [Phragmites australis]